MPPGKGCYFLRVLFSIEWCRASCSSPVLHCWITWHQEDTDGERSELPPLYSGSAPWLYIGYPPLL